MRIKIYTDDQLVEGIKERCRNGLEFARSSHFQIGEYFVVCNIEDKHRAQVIVSMMTIEDSDNNGWTKIKPDGSNLPDPSDPGLFTVGKRTKREFYEYKGRLESWGLKSEFLRKEITHFRRSMKDMPPKD